MVSQFWIKLWAAQWLAFLACCGFPLAAQAAGECMNIAIAKAAITSHNGQWIELLAEQRLFLVGVYAMNPNTPPGLPSGDKAALAQVYGDNGGLVFFIDGEKACTPMAIPRELIVMMNDLIEMGHEKGPAKLRPPRAGRKMTH